MIPRPHQKLRAKTPWRIFAAIFYLPLVLFLGSFSGRAQAVTTLTPPVASIPVNATQFAVDPVRPRVYTTDITTNSVHVFNTDSLTLEKTIPVGVLPRGLALSVDGEKLFVANGQSVGASFPDYIISVIDLESLTMLPALHVPYTPYDLEEGLEGRLYISSSEVIPGGSYVFQIDSATGEFQGFVGSGGPFPSLLEISPDRRTLYSGSTTYGNERLVKYDVSTPTATTLQALATFESGPGQITLSHDGSFICYSLGIVTPGVYSPPAVALFTDDLTVKGTFAYGAYGPLRAPLALSPDDLIAYQLDAELDLPLGPGSAVEASIVIRLRSTATFRQLDNIVFSLEGNMPIPVAMTTDQTGRYLFVASPFETLVYDVSPRIESSPPLIGLAGSPFTYQTLLTFDAATFSAASLPPGLEINSEGVITGTPAEKGNFTATVTASRGPVQVSQSFDFRIDGSRLKNISTRAYVDQQSNTMIGGFIIDGAVSKTVVVRILGPSLAAYGIPLIDKNPAFRLYNGQGIDIYYNNDWALTNDQTIAALEASGLAPSDPVESAIIVTLKPGAYTAVVEPGGGGAETDFNGNALFEVYDVDENSLSRLGNISTRAYADALSPVIAGFITQGPGADNLLIRGIGPSLSASGVPNPLPDPFLELHDSQGSLIASNDNWRETQEAEIIATGIPPSDDLEPALLVSLPSGPYTAILQNLRRLHGVCLVEVYHLP